MKVQLRTTSLLQVYIKVCLKKVIENQLTEYLITKIDDNLSVGFVTICLWAVIIGPVFFSHSWVVGMAWSPIVVPTPGASLISNDNNNTIWMTDSDCLYLYYMYVVRQYSLKIFLTVRKFMSVLLPLERSVCYTPSTTAKSSLHEIPVWVYKRVGVIR